MATRSKRRRVSSAHSGDYYFDCDFSEEVGEEGDSDDDPSWFHGSGSDSESEEGLQVTFESPDSLNDNADFGDDHDDMTEIRSNSSASDETEDADSADEAGMTDWVRNLNNYPLKAPFTGQTGIQVPVPEDASPLFFYKLFLTQDVIKLIKRETNVYAAECVDEKQREAERRNQPLGKRSWYRTWKPVTEDEVWTFITILIHMGIVKKPKLTDYWTTVPATHTAFASTLMKRDRFRSILAFFHLNRNDAMVPRGQEGHDPLHKLRPLVDHLVEVCIVSSS